MRLSRSNRSVGLRCAGVVEGRDWGTCGAHQAECSCHEPDGQPCAAVTAVKSAKAKQSRAGTVRGSRKRSSFSALFQVP